MNTIVLRTATAEDREFAYAVKKAAFRCYVEKVWSWDEDEQRRMHEQRFREQEFRIIRFDDVDVGIMAVVGEPDCVKLNQLFLLPEYQGRGIGRRCMALLIEDAAAHGLPIRLRVLKVNPRAVTFYERLGFHHTGATETHELMEWRKDAP